MGELRLDAKKIGETICVLRKNKGETVSEAAKACGVSSQAWSQYESGSRIAKDSVKLAIAMHYGGNVGDIFYAQVAHV